MTEGVFLLPSYINSLCEIYTVSTIGITMREMTAPHTLHTLFFMPFEEKVAFFAITVSGVCGFFGVCLRSPSSNPQTVQCLRPAMPNEEQVASISGSVTILCPVVRIGSPPET